MCRRFVFCHGVQDDVEGLVQCAARVVVHVMLCGVKER
jgi:hypothetical protein